MIAPSQATQVFTFLFSGGTTTNSLEGNQTTGTDSDGESFAQEELSTPSSPSPSSAPSVAGTSQKSGVAPTQSAKPVVETESQAAAKQRAATYLTQDFSSSMRPLFSRVIIIQKLREDGFSPSDAAYAAGAVAHDWSAEAELMAIDYVADPSNSRLGLIADLTAEGFTQSESNFAIAQLEASYPNNFYWETIWLDQADRYLAAELYSGANFSRNEAVSFLLSAGFTGSEANAVVSEYIERQWEDSALLSAMDYRFGNSPAPSNDQVEDYLRSRGFTQSNIDYAMSHL